MNQGFSMALTLSNLLLLESASSRYYMAETENQREKSEADEITSIQAEMDWEPTQDTKEKTEKTEDKEDATDASEIERRAIRGKRDMIITPADRYALFFHGKWPTTNPTDEYIGVGSKQGMRTSLLALHELYIIYDHPHLHEYIFHQTLKYKTPLTLVNLISDHIPFSTFPQTGSISILNSEAGNGMLGRQLRNHSTGVEDRMHITGPDTSSNALAAVKRHQLNRPGGPQIYNDYLVLDLTNATSPIVKGFNANPFHIVIISQALGPGPRDVTLDVFDVVVECLLDGSHIVVMIEEQNILNRRLVDKIGSLAKPRGKFVNKLEKRLWGWAWCGTMRGLI